MPTNCLFSMAACQPANGAAHDLSLLALPITANSPAILWWLSLNTVSLPKYYPGMLRTTIFVLWVFALSAHAETLSGYVVDIADGDTITVLDANLQQHKIRLQGIDAPEKAQPFGWRSKKNLSQLVFNKDVRVEWIKRDKYKRIVGKVWVQPSGCPNCPMTFDAGHAQITVGLGWRYRKYASEQPAQDRGQYEFSEQEAKAKRVGLWRDPEPIPPWEWRRR
jgi:endonuclease YncB( thermonuclease family)